MECRWQYVENSKYLRTPFGSLAAARLPFTTAARFTMARDWQRGLQSLGMLVSGWLVGPRWSLAVE